MAEFLDLVLKLSLVIFMGGAMFQTGLGMSLTAVSSGVRDPRFLAYGFVFSLGLGPLVAWALTQMIPLAEPYALGLLLLGLTPAAPFLPQMVAHAKGELSFAPAMLLIAAISTMILMPIAVPVMAPGLNVTPWSIARPLLLVVFLPLVAGLVLRRFSAARAAAMIPTIRIITGVATLVMLILCAVIYGRSFAETVGQRAILALALFFLIVTPAAYLGARGLLAGAAQRDRPRPLHPQRGRCPGAALLRRIGRPAGHRHGRSGWRADADHRRADRGALVRMGRAPHVAGRPASDGGWGHMTTVQTSAGPGAVRAAPRQLSPPRRRESL